MDATDARGAVDNCVRCERPMVRGRHKNARPGPGQVRHEAHGKCRNCYALQQRAAHPKPKGRRTYRHREYDIDDVIIDRAVGGHKPNMNPKERGVAVDILTNQRLPVVIIAERLGCTMRTVQRHRARNRAQTLGRAA